LVRRLEPRASLPRHRLAAVEKLAKAGVPVGVLVAPVIPALNDHEIPSILKAAASAGAQWAGKVVLRLPHAVAAVFQQWLDQHAPDRKEKVLHQIRALRGGRLNDPNFGTRMRGEGVRADQQEALFAVTARKAGLADRGPELSTAAFRSPLSESRNKQSTFPFFSPSAAEGPRHPEHPRRPSTFVLRGGTSSDSARP
jgi:DNA repair photolyase